MVSPVFLREIGGSICARVGHDFRIKLPPQIRHRTKEVCCECATCLENRWIQLPEDGYKQLLEDIESGKLKTPA